MLRTLYAKLVAAFLALILALGMIYLLLAVLTTRLHVQEVTQRLGQPLAQGIVEQKLLMREGRIDHGALEELFHMLMVVNPAIEVYLLDAQGRILAYSAPPGKVARTEVALAPVHRFLEGADALPILGDDPRQHGRRKIFSAAPVYDDGTLAGYLYVVLAGEQYDSVAQLLQGSYILRLSGGIAAASLLLTVGAGLLAFAWLTRRLRRLAAVMERFRQSGFRQPITADAQSSGGGDEIAQLGTTFAEMSARIVAQFEALERADADRRELVASISHDLRTPLASLQGYLETLSIKEDTLAPEERRRYVALAHAHARRLGRLIEELFELTRLEAHETVPAREPFSIGELVQDVAQKFRLEAEKKALDLETEIPPTTPFVMGDIGLIERVLENLIENAVKYTPSGGRVSLALSTRPGAVTTSVRDTGPGIAADDLPHIFERFYRARRHRPDEPEGTGLGLAIARRILELHGSRIEVDSAPGAGTAFAFSLPPAPA